ncbi:unnamed protein product, partial [Ascophyllum nodosum]
RGKATADNAGVDGDAGEGGRRGPEVCECRGVAGGKRGPGTGRSCAPGNGEYRKLLLSKLGAAGSAGVRAVRERPVSSRSW